MSAGRASRQSVWDLPAAPGVPRSAPSDPMPNRLADANSPYLLQHADNPVDWWPWSDAAFEEAQRRGVPVFLSIGYATCHWCHVMEHESFEDAEAARALNDAFVCIKVDREERPDVDGVYMAAVLAATGRGGWPLTALLTPDTREPFWVGTYLPKASRGGRVGLLDLAENVSRFWSETPDAMRQSAAELAAHVRAHEGSGSGEALGRDDLDATAGALRQRFDAQHGGVGAAPKFPTPHHALFLLRRWRQKGEDDLGAMAVTTLRAIRRGGVYDQLGGGLHRYSTDREWRLPHFEKMLYDQALYALACTEAWAATGEPDLREAAEATLAYVLRDLRSPTGAFFSAEDADSLTAEGEREEGAFYVWTEAEVDAALAPSADSGQAAEDARVAKAVWGTAPEGNYLDEATRQRTGANVLHVPRPHLGEADPLADAAERFGLDAETLHLRLDRARRRLFEARAERPRPLLDDKVLTDWNGLAIAALAVAARTLGRDDYAEAATDAARFLLGTMCTEAGDLLHRYRDGKAGIDGLLDDYAFLVWGLIELYQTTFDEALLEAGPRPPRPDARALRGPSRRLFRLPRRRARPYRPAEVPRRRRDPGRQQRRGDERPPPRATDGRAGAGGRGAARAAGPRGRAAPPVRLHAPDDGGSVRRRPEPGGRGRGRPRGRRHLPASRCRPIRVRAVRRYRAAGARWRARRRSPTSSRSRPSKRPSTAARQPTYARTTPARRRRRAPTTPVSSWRTPRGATGEGRRGESLESRGEGRGRRDARLMYEPPPP